MKINPIAAHAWQRENGISLESATALREITDTATRLTSHRTRARGLGYLRGWDDCRNALSFAIGREFRRILAAHSEDPDARPGDLVTASEIASRIETILAEHSAYLRTRATEEEAA